MSFRLLPAGALFTALAGLLLAQGHRPEVAAGKMTTPAGFRARLVAAEPLVRQPVAIDFDDRGRLWVMQYLQYPNPAGLKRAQVDRYSRTVYDRVPEPPPRGPRGADRLTILNDPDADGRLRRGKDFLSGLNLASAFAFGHGGVFVLQVPYLLFYPDRDGDDVPDDDPDVLLTGFGMEDAHSVANSLTWGPDGWLYGCQGSTVTARVRGIEFQQGVWRYHPITRRFELFCEGGGNSWGLDFDRHGNLLYSTNHGGFVLLHGVQGGYYWKSFGKHGPLHNPFAFGYFDHVPHQGFKGGHVTVGGIVYRGHTFGPRFRDRSIGADLLGHNVYWHEIEPVGSTFRTRFAGDLLLGNDTWFAPSDVVAGPDGSVYVSDWHDRRTAHPDPDADWDRSNGRVYRIEAAGTKPYTLGDLRKLTSKQLVALLSSDNDWLVRRARRILADRRDPEVIFPLRDLVRHSKDDQLALEALWALYVSGGFDERFAGEALGQSNPHVRRWAVRFLGDEGKVSATLASQLIGLSTRETNAVVRSQLASSAQRFEPGVAVPMIRGLLTHAADRSDPHIPLLLWWAVERHAVAALEEVVALFDSAKGWDSTIARETIQHRLLRRLAAEGTSKTLAGCVRLLRAAPATERSRLLAALDEGLRDRPAGAARTPGELGELLAAWWKPDATDAGLIRVRMRLGHLAGHERAVAIATDPRAAVSLREAMLGALAEMGRPGEASAVLKLIGGSEPERVQRAAVEALARFDRGEVAAELIARYPRLTPSLRARVRGVLLARRAGATQLVAAVEAKRIPAADVSSDELRPVALFGDAGLSARVRRLWGRVEAATPEERLAEVRRLNNDLRAAAGDATVGKALFKQHCATCHRLFGEGGTIGPDLMYANRQDRQALLVSIVDPSAVVRREYLAWVVRTTDGRVLTGLLIEQTPGQLTLVDAKNERTIVPRSRVESLEESPASLMPDNLLRDLKSQQVRDLFAYLESKR